MIEYQSYDCNVAAITDESIRDISDESSIYKINSLAKLCIFKVALYSKRICSEDHSNVA